MVNPAAFKSRRHSGTTLLLIATIGFIGRGLVHAQSWGASTSNPVYIYPSTVVNEPVGIGIGSTGTALGSQLFISSNTAGRTGLIVDQFQSSVNILDLRASGTSKLSVSSLGNVGVGAAPIASTGFLLSPTGISGSGIGLSVNPSFVAGNNAFNRAGYFQLKVANSASAVTVTDGVGLYVDSPSPGTNVSLTNRYGLFIADQTGGTSAFAIKTGLGNVSFGGNVGIGTNAPNGIFDVRPAAAASGAGLPIILSAQQSGASSPGGNVLINGGPNGSSGTNGSILFGIGGAINSNGTFASGEKMRIDPTGNVIIGATAPNGGLLTVNGAVGISGTIRSGGDINFTQANFNLYGNTTDGADNAKLTINAGGGLSEDVNRGAYISLRGNENASPGSVQIAAGNMPGGKISMLTGSGIQAFSIDANQLTTVSSLNVSGKASVGVGGSATDVAFYLSTPSSGLSGTSNVGLISDVTFPTTATQSIQGIRGYVRTSASSYTVASAQVINVTNPIKGAGSTITDAYGIKIENISAGSNNNYSIHTGTGKVHFGGYLDVASGMDISGNVNFLGERLQIGGTDNNAVINSNFSTRLNIDADNNSTGESFIIGKDQAAIDQNNVLFKVQENGYVGIGKSNPTATLDVNGSANISGIMKFSGNSGEGIVLNRSLGNGYIAWQNGSGVDAWALQRNETNGSLVLWPAGSAANGQFKIANALSGSPVFTIDIPNASLGLTGSQTISSTLGVSGLVTAGAGISIPDGQSLVSTISFPRTMIGRSGTYLYVGDQDGWTDARYRIASGSHGFDIGGSTRVSIGVSDVTLNVPDLAFSAQTAQIRSNTAAGTDSKRLVFSGGGSANPTRGAHLALYGNQYSAVPGDAQVIAGQNGAVRLKYGLNSSDGLVVDKTGNVALGANAGTQVIVGSLVPNTTPGVKLDVEGHARVSGALYANTVKTTSWGVSDTPPDYVFDRGYKLASLDHVEEYVTENKHLQDIPSAKEIMKDGIDLAEMNMKLLKKVEELTLYSIQQNKRVKAQEVHSRELENEIRSLKNAVLSLSKARN